jgi:hypothetical protein
MNLKSVQNIACAFVAVLLASSAAAMMASG